MPNVNAGRYTADVSELGDEVIVFLIGMRLNRPWKLLTWWPVFSAMPRMLTYLANNPERGLLGFHQGLLPSPLVVQYWRSFEDLERFARDKADPHLEPWRRFNRRVGASGDVGVWHETYRVKTTDLETIYVNMPPKGLAAACRTVPVTGGQNSAGARIAASRTDLDT